MRRPRHLVLLVAATLTLLAACASSDTATPTADDTTTTTVGTTVRKQSSTTSTTSTTVNSTSEIKQAYQDAFRALAEASTNSSPQQVDLGAHFEDSSLEDARSALGNLAGQGLHVEYPSGLPTPTVETVDVASASSAHIVVCLIDNGIQVQNTNGTIINSGVLSERTSAQMHKSNDTWKVQTATSLSSWPDAHGCDR